MLDFLRLWAIVDIYVHQIAVVYPIILIISQMIISICMLKYVIIIFSCYVFELKAI